MSTAAASGLFTGHVVPTLRLAIPVTLERAGLLIMLSVDIAMSGHYSDVALASYGLATALLLPPFLVCIGILLGTQVLTAQAVGRRIRRHTGNILRLGWLYALVLGVLLLALCATGEWLFRLSGQPSELVIVGGAVLSALGWGMPGILLFAATVLFLEGLERPLPGMVIVLFGNLLNAALNWALIFGHLGLPALGAEGAAFATSIVRWAMFAAALGYVLTRIDRARYGLIVGTRIIGFRTLARRMRVTGLPIAAAQGLESSAFAMLSVMSGWVGVRHVAAFSVAMNLLALVFMMALGFSTAASVRVAVFLGAADVRAVARAGWTAAVLIVVAMCCVGVLSLLLRDHIGVLFTSETTIAALLSYTLVVTALMMAPDGLQAVLMGALRGISDVWAATLRQAVAFWLIMMPIAWYAGVVRGGGAPALMFAAAVGTVAASLLLGLRFRHTVRTLAAGVRTR